MISICGCGDKSQLCQYKGHAAMEVLFGSVYWSYRYSVRDSSAVASPSLQTSLQEHCQQVDLLLFSQQHLFSRCSASTDRIKKPVVCFHSADKAILVFNPGEFILLCCTYYFLKNTCDQVTLVVILLYSKI